MFWLPNGFPSWTRQSCSEVNRCGTLQSILASSAIPKIPCSLLVLFELVRGSGILGNAVAVWLQSASSHRCGREAPAARRAPTRLVGTVACQLRRNASRRGEPVHASGRSTEADTGYQPAPLTIKLSLAAKLRDSSYFDPKRAPCARHCWKHVVTWSGWCSMETVMWHVYRFPFHIL